MPEIGAAMRLRSAFAIIAALAVLAGSATLWLGTRSAAPSLDPVGVGPSALYAASFTDLRGANASLGAFRGKVVVLNFWATWCAPCREEMPAFARLEAKWAGRGVRFVGLSSEDAPTVARFAQELAIGYPLWVGAEVEPLASRLGNTRGFLPFTVILSPQGAVLMRKVGAYKETDLDAQLALSSPNGAD
jgi:thiol-disulfide isomerase/thioredoxin